MALSTNPTWRVYATGTGEFPIDMLRYDSCYPMTEADSGLIGQTGERRVALLSHAQALTPDRWQSFGWKIETIKNR